MAFYSRIIGETQPKLRIHEVAALAREVLRGNMANTTAFDLLKLDREEAVEFDSLVKSVAISAEVEAIWDAFYLGERRVPGYATGDELRAKVTGGKLKPLPVAR